MASIYVSACTPSPGESAAAPALEAAPESNEAARIAAIVDPLIGSDLSASGIPGAAFVFVRDGRIVYTRGYGVSDVATSSAVDPEKTVWPIASITKVITAMAALQMVDHGHVELDADINRYVKRLQVPSQGYGPLTLRHLLSHTAALDELPGRQFDGRQPPDMAAFLKDRLVRYRAPGGLTAYSTYGMALAGVLVEDATGQNYADYLVRHILTPAGMNRSWIMTAQGDEKGVATPYEVEDRRAEAVPHEWYVTTPTSSMVASVSDMGRLLLVHLANGNAGANRLLTPELTRAMQTQQATVHPDLPGWGLGFQLDRVNGKSLAEHGGDIAGFSSLFSIIPEENAGFFIVHHGESGDLRFRVKQALMDALYPAKVLADVPATNPKNTERLAEYSGRYISSFACRSCPEAAEQAFSITAEADGTLALWGQRWVPLHRDLFIRDDGKRMLGFARDSEGSIVSVSGGSWRVADRLNNS
jgi:CubicO group peptidase (beta-lactamase class C family)